jgi:hypothetical protein
MLRKLSLRGGLTYLRDSPVKGLTWKQYKAARFWIKKHKRELNGMSISRTMEFMPRVIRLASILSPRKHGWDI